MQLRLIEIILPASSEGAIAELPNTEALLGRWDDLLDDGTLLVRLLIDVKNTESLLDHLQDRFSQLADFRVMLIPVEATIPRPPTPEQEPTEKANKQRISREELYNDVAESAVMSPVFIAQAVIATLVAAVGLVRDDTAVLVGAMVIAPLLGPNVSLSLGTVLGDAKLVLQSLKTNVTGIAIALTVSIALGFIMTIDHSSQSIQARTHVSVGDIILALSAGSAGVLAFTTGAPSALIGVMVAVALLPPTAVVGLTIAAKQWDLAAGAMMLVATNVICVNLAGILTFLVQGVQPRTWHETKRAKTATGVAVFIWTIFLALLLGLIFFVTQRT